MIDPSRRAVLTGFGAGFFLNPGFYPLAQAENNPVPLIATASLEEGLQFPDFGPPPRLGLMNYIGSAAMTGWTLLPRRARTASRSCKPKSKKSARPTCLARPMAARLRVCPTIFPARSWLTSGLTRPAWQTRAMMQIIFILPAADFQIPDRRRFLFTGGGQLSG